LGFIKANRKNPLASGYQPGGAMFAINLDHEIAFQNDKILKKESI
jgi:hypothetical protein